MDWYVMVRKLPEFCRKSKWQVIAPGKIRKYAIYPPASIGPNGKLRRTLFKDKKQGIKEVAMQYSIKSYEIRAERVST